MSGQLESREHAGHVAVSEETFDPKRFEGKWIVLEGTIPGEPGKTNRWVILERISDTEFHLSYRKGDGPVVPHQTLYYNEKTRTLDSKPGDGRAERCISFWDCASMVGDKCRIFAMRRLPETIPPSVDREAFFMDFEPKTDNGTWGAEQG